MGSTPEPAHLPGYLALIAPEWERNVRRAAWARLRIPEVNPGTWYPKRVPQSEGIGRCCTPHAVPRCPRPGDSTTDEDSPSWK